MRLAAGVATVPWFEGRRGRPRESDTRSRAGEDDEAGGKREPVARSTQGDVVVVGGGGAVVIGGGGAVVAGAGGAVVVAGGGSVVVGGWVGTGGSAGAVEGGGAVVVSSTGASSVVLSGVETETVEQSSPIGIVVVVVLVSVVNVQSFVVGIGIANSPRRQYLNSG